MRYALISDIHSNIHAIEKVFSILEGENIDQIICLGDYVGYNANPVECIKAVQSHPKITHMVKGNHDEDVCGFEHMRFSQIRELSKDAYDGLKYSSSILNEKHKDWLTVLPEDKLIENNELPFWISHRSPNHCTAYGYILSEPDARVSLDVLRKYKKGSNLFFFGHSHIPTFAMQESGNIVFDTGRHLENNTYIIEPDNYYLINPGSIGQPRRNGITSYAIFDTEEGTVSIKGFEYDFKAAQKAVLDAGYSSAIANRLDQTYDEKKDKKKAKKERCKRQQKVRDALKSSEEGGLNDNVDA